MNDVLVAALSSGLRKWATVDKKDDKNATLYSVIWVSKSPMSDVYKSIKEKPILWGNDNLCAVYMPMPCNKNDPGNTHVFLSM